MVTRVPIYAGGTAGSTAITARSNLAVGEAHADGSAGSPSISFSAENDTGFYRSGTDEVSFALGGAQTATFNLSGLNIVSGDEYNIAGTSVLSATALGSAVITSSLTSFGALPEVSVTDTISAAGSANTTATALTTHYNRVTTVVASSADGVSLPDAVSGLEVVIINDDSADALAIWPAAADDIDGGGVDAEDGTPLPAGEARTYIALDTTNWSTATGSGGGGGGGDGSVTPTDESSDITTFPLFVNAATGNQVPHTNASLGFDAASGALFLGGTIAASSDLTTGIVIDQGTANDGVLVFKSSDVTHGMTDDYETDTFGIFQKYQDTSGGLMITGLTDANDTSGFNALYLRSFIGEAAVTTNSTNSVAAMGFSVYKKASATTAVLGDTENAYMFHNGFGNGTGLMLIKGDGHLWIRNDLSFMANDFTINVPTNGMTISGGLLNISGGPLSIPGADSITADSNQDFANATLLDNNWNIITTVATAGDAIALPFANVGMAITIINAGANSLQVFPADGASDHIDSGAVNVVDPNSLAAGDTRTYMSIDGTEWTTIFTNTTGGYSGGGINAGTAGTNVTAVHSGDGVNITVTLTLLNVVVTVGDSASLGLGALIYTLPAGNLTLHNSYMEIDLSAITQTAETPELGLGSVIASGVITELTGTQEDYSLGTPAMDDSNGTAKIAYTVNDINILTGGTKTVHANLALAWGANADASGLLNGTVVLQYTFNAA